LPRPDFTSVTVIYQLVMLVLGSLLARQQLSCLESSFGLLWWRDRLRALELRLATLDRMIAAESGGRGAVEVGLHLSNLMKDLKIAVQEKESQCQTFRELLLEKENEVEELSKLVEEKNDSDIVKKTLEDVLRSAGKSVNGDNGYEQLLSMVTELVQGGEKVDAEKGDVASAEDVVMKLGDENEVLSRECKQLNEKVLQLQASNGKCLECVQSLEVVNNLKQEVELMKQTNSDGKDSELIFSLKEQLDESNKNVSSLSEELQTCKQHKNAAENEFLEERSVFQQQLSEKIAVITELSEKNHLVQTELDSNKVFNQNLTMEINRLKISLDEESLENSAKITEMTENHAREFSVLRQEMDAASGDMMSQMVETNKSEVAVLKVTEQELLAQLGVEKTNSYNLQFVIEQGRSDLASLLMEKNSIETKLESSVKELDDLQGRFDESRTSCKNLKLELEEAHKIKDNLEAMLDSNITESQNIKNLRQKLESADKSVKDMKNQLDNTEARRADVELKLENQSSVNEELQTKLDVSLESVISCTMDLQAKLDNALKMNKELQLELDTNFSNYQAEIQDTQCRLSLAEKSLEDVQMKLDSGEETRKELQSKLECFNSNEQDLQCKLDASKEKLEKLLLENENTLKSEKELVKKLYEEQQLSKELKSKIDSESSNQVQFLELENSNKDLQLKLDNALTSSQEQLDAMQNKLNSSESQSEMLNEIEEKLVDAESRNSLLLEEQQMFKDKYSDVQRSLNCSSQEVEDLYRKVTELEQSNNVCNNGKDELEKKFTSLSVKSEELESDNFDLKLSNSSLNENFLQAKENSEVQNVKSEESKKQIEGLKVKEADFMEAINSLKSINEMISKSARDNEKGKKELEIKLETIELERNTLDISIQGLENKNIELNSQIQLIVSQKKELEFCFVESQNSMAGLKEEIKQLSLAKEARVAEEKDVDESEQSAIDKNMVQVLNEKIRENTQMKSENNYLLQNITAEREAREKLESELAECKQTYSSMNTETVKKLSMLVRDKDLEIESLSARNKSLLEVIDNEKGVDREKEENGKEAKLLEEIRKLKDENIKDKDSVENSNELLYLKGRITELERKLNSEALEKVADNSHTSFDESNSHQEEVDVGDRSLVLRLETKSMQLESVEKQAALIDQELSEVRSNMCKKEEEQFKLKEEASRSKAREAELQQEVERVRRSLMSIQGLLEEKTTSNVSQQEQGLKYITECERLSKELSQMSSERDTAVTQGKARLQEAQDLRREVSSIIEKKKRVEGEVERLRGHLVQVEEGYTVELMEGEEREKDLRKRVAQLEDQLRVATHTSSEVTENASQASTQLTAALETAASQRDKLSDQLASCQASLRTRNMELRNLQLALEGFQRQKENEIGMAEQNCEARVTKEQRVVGDLQEKLRVNKQQLDRAQQGLEAAARLSEQLDKKGVLITNLKQEISVREEMVKNMQEKLLVLSSSQVGRVDRDLVKNLVVGYVTADDSKKAEVLRIIATVLDFNSEERGRTGLEGGVGGWLGGLLGSRSRHPSISQAPVEQSIAKAFIQFLEEESTPRNIVTLPVLEMARSKAEQLAGRAGKTPSPLLSASPTLSLPSLGSHNSHSPSILKSVLDEPEKEASS